MNQFRIDQVDLTIRQEQVCHRDEPLPLSARGHRCLMELLRANQTVLTKAHLMDALWQEVIVSEDSLFKVIQEVRKELSHLGIPKDALKNIYGKGYQLQQTKPIEKQEKNNKPLLILGLLACLVCLSALVLWQWGTHTKDTLPDDKFDALVADIRSDYKKNAIGDQNFGIDAHSSPLDQLKLSYLKGLEKYKSGNYEQSIAFINEGINTYGNEPSTRVLADSYLLLCRIYIYRKDKDALFRYLKLAKEHYQAIGDQKGITAVGISTARYHQSIFDYQTSIEQLNKLLIDLEGQNDPHSEARIHANLAYSYKQTNQKEKNRQALEKTLALSLDSSNGRYAVYAYGELSAIYKETGEPLKAMEHAILTLNYVLKQKDTNVFQQGFSSFYNLLNELGHHQLAEKYLIDAINVQAHFNDEALLTVAEMNLARVYLNTQKFTQARATLEALLATKLPVNEQLEAEALLAASSYGLDDNITAYTKAKKVYAHPKATDRVKAQAGIVLAMVSHQLERNNEAKQVLSEVEQTINPHWLFEYNQFLNLHHHGLQNPQSNVQSHEEKVAAFQTKVQSIREQTQPPPKLLDELDRYISDILKQSKPLQ